MEIKNNNTLYISTEEFLNVENLNIKDKRKIKKIIITDSLDSINIRCLSEMISNFRLFPLANYEASCSYALINTIIAFNSEEKVTGLKINITDDIPETFENLNIDDLNFKINLPLKIAFLLSSEELNELLNKDEITIDGAKGSLFLNKYNELKLKCERIKQDINYDKIQNGDEELKKWLDLHLKKYENDESASILSDIIYQIITRSKNTNQIRK